MFAKVSPLTGTVDDHAAFVNLAASPLSALHQSAISSLANSETSVLTTEATCQIVN